MPKSKTEDLQYDSKPFVEQIHLGQFEAFASLYLCYCADEVFIDKWLTRRKGKESDAAHAWNAVSRSVYAQTQAWGWVSCANSKAIGNDAGPIAFIVLPNGFKGTKVDWCALAHECVHICQFILSNMLDRDKEVECEAYFHTYLMRMIVDTIEYKS
ncbi:MAG: hypothetical protein JNL32_16280, partial [Candidatus Kapabacteria bacterium]|nr:hypothetical protein [Candidatus Kapabacteria bacterium]